MRHFVLVWCGEANQRSPKRPLALHNCPITGVEMVVWLIDWPVIGQVRSGETHGLPHVVVVVDVVDNTVGKKSYLGALKVEDVRLAGQGAPNQFEMCRKIKNSKI